MRNVLLLMADTHGGSDVGLCNPETKLWDKYSRRSWCSPKMTNTQELLFEKFDEHLRKAKLFCDGDPVTVIHLGDMTHGGVFLTDVSEARFLGQYQIAKYNMYHIFNILGDSVKYALFLEGTNVHTYDGSIEHVLADLLREKYDIGCWCYPHAVLRVGDTTHDLSHHGPSPGKRVWTKANPASSWLRSAMIKYVMRGEAPPTAFYRAHFHEWLPTITNREMVVREEGVEQYESHFQFVPGYSGLSDHSRKATQSEDTVYWGMVLVEIIDSRLVSFHALVHAEDTRIREEVVCE